MPPPEMMGCVKKRVWAPVVIAPAPSFRSALTFTNPPAFPALRTGTAWTGWFLSFDLEHGKVW